MCASTPVHCSPFARKIAWPLARIEIEFFIFLAPLPDRAHQCDNGALHIFVSIKYQSFTILPDRSNPITVNRELFFLFFYPGHSHFGIANRNRIDWIVFNWLQIFVNWKLAQSDHILEINSTKFVARTQKNYQIEMKTVIWIIFSLYFSYLLLVFAMWENKTKRLW